MLVLSLSIIILFDTISKSRLIVRSFQKNKKEGKTTLSWVLVLLMDLGDYCDSIRDDDILLVVKSSVRKVQYRWISYTGSSLHIGPIEISSLYMVMFRYVYSYGTGVGSRGGCCGIVAHYCSFIVELSLF